MGEELLKDLEFSHHQPLSSRVFCFPGGSPGQRHIVQPHLSKELGLSKTVTPPTKECEGLTCGTLARSSGKKTV